MIKTDVKKKKKTTCRNMFGIKKGNVEKLHTEFFCSSLLFCICHFKFGWIKGKKKKKYIST